MAIKELIDLFQNGGSGVLFLALYLITLVYFFREMKAQYVEMKKSKDEIVELTVRITTALDMSRNAMERNNTIMGEMRVGLDQNMAQTREFVAYLRGRDGRPS